MQSKIFLLFFILTFLVVSCATSPKGRKQILFMPESQMAQMGLKSFEQMKKDSPIEKDPKINAYVNCIVQPILKAAGPVEGVDKWEVIVFQDKSANAFALPGGRIGVHMGLLKVAETPDQLAAVIGHEVGHVMAKHGNERVSENMGANALLVFAGVAAQKKKKEYGLAVAALGGPALQFGILLPHSRAQESEADLIGLDLMAQAGFNPQDSVELWKNMGKSSGGKSVPEFMSTHPSHGTRTKTLSQNIPKVMGYYLDAKNKGMAPTCKM